MSRFLWYTVYIGKSKRLPFNSFHYVTSECRRKMANFVRHIASFSDESINVALNAALDVTARGQFVDTLRDVADLLEKPAKKKKTQKRASLTATKNFQEKVLPQIERKLCEYQVMEESGEEMKWNVKLEYDMDFINVNLQTLISTHKLIVTQEGNLENLKLVVAFHRGLLYLARTCVCARGCRDEGLV